MKNVDKSRPRKLFAVYLWLTLMLVTVGAQASVESGSYLINAGDVLAVDVFNETNLSEEQVVVRPDGFISVPVVGEVKVGGKTVQAAQDAIAAELDQFLKDEPNVVIQVIATQGSRVFVVGKVQRPGVFALTGQLDVIQALALAGGLNQFAAENRIKVLRRDENGEQATYKFRYSDIRDGEKLETNILLRSGDVVLVP